MTPEGEAVGNQSSDDETVVSAIDEIEDRPHLVIADIGRDDAWLSMTERDAVSLDAWR
ncbi:DUF7556 family protein [Haloterrigena alkaliphila]|uniref:Uncharacterized protein n=1 Tax=Haloterrigena alkaliphila TaxID=2816475 RepID=A0A8A2VE57_9EURY|nr:hypothetical protein [Haloterrigena alkaliphila]QSW98555.1 hypothetical protein J0X25_14310 [Haloterrigena alkaliphila]